MTDKQNFDDLKTPPLAWIGVVSVLGTVTVVLFLQVWYFSFVGQSTPTNEGPRPYEQLLANQQKTLDSYAIIDQENGRAGIPISVAMRQVVSELAAADGQEPQQNPVDPPPGDADETKGAALDSAAGTPDESPTKEQSPSEDEAAQDASSTDDTAADGSAIDESKTDDSEAAATPETEDGEVDDEKPRKDMPDNSEVETP
jgi:FlaG/FlaF family flagellin (archaellin)